MIFIKYKKWTLVVLSFTLLPTIAYAHRSGCHRWHSCPSDSGSYVCGDLGYTSGCPTYSAPKPITNSTVKAPVNALNKTTISKTVTQTTDFNIEMAKVVNYKSELPAVLTLSAALRKCPSKDCEVIRYYWETALVSVIGSYENDQWFRIRAKDDSGIDISGWMHNSVLKLNKKQETPVEIKATSSVVLVPQTESTETRKNWIKFLWSLIRGK
ncbi:MAG: hypothetical protein M3Q24_01400 [bacterium]|nr:hypothetical protein [bacterium]